MSDAERRTTRQQRAVHTSLRGSVDFVSAQDLHMRLRQQGEEIGLATVYRTLSGLTDDGLVDMLRAPDGEARYRWCSTSDHHHHLVCRACGATVEIEGPAVEEWAERAAAQHGFSEVSHTLEVFGRCARCRDSQSSRFATLLHLCARDEWMQAQAEGVRRPAGFASDGFVHCSTPDQVHLPANRLFAGRSDLVLLEIDRSRLDAQGIEVRFEPGATGDRGSMLFPHAYAPIPVDAVLGVHPYRPGPDGRFGPPELP